MKMLSLFSWLRAAVVCAAVGFSFAFPVASARADGVGAVATQIPASAYVQDGLIAQWDGIENAGAGTHDANATEWKALVGDIDFPLTGCEVSSDAISIPGGVSPTVERSIFGSPAYSQPTTIELNWATPGLPEASTYSDYFLFASDESYFYRQNNTQAIFPVLVKGSPNKHWSKFAYTTAEQRTFATASFVNGATALSDCGLYYNGSRRERVGDATTSTLSAIRNRTSLCLSTGSRSYAVKYRSIRVYNRKLSADEITINANIDKVRFGSADPAELTWPEGYRFNAEARCVESTLKLAYDTTRGSVSVDGAATEPSEGWVEFGSEHVLTATSAAGYRFVAWGGDIGGDGRLSSTLTISTGRPVSVCAYFAPISGLDSSSYLQDGLIAQWDGIDNAGTGVHDPAATSWKELKRDLATTATALTFDDNSAVFDGKATSGTLVSGRFPEALAAISNGAFTADVYFRPNAYTQYSGLFHFGLSGATRYFSLSADIHKTGGSNSPIGAFQYKRDSWNADNCYSCALAELGRPCNVAAIADGSHHSLYVNRTCASTHNAGTYVKYASTDFAFGRYATSNSQRANMNLYAVRLYDRVLTPYEIAYNLAVDQIRFLGAEAAAATGYRQNPETGAIEFGVMANANVGGTVGVAEEGGVATQGATAVKWFGLGTEATAVVTAVPADGYVFVAWTDLTGGLKPEALVNPTLTLTQTAPCAVRANFRRQDAAVWTYSKSANTISLPNVVLTCSPTAGRADGLTLTGVSTLETSLVDLRLLPIVGEADGLWYELTAIGNNCFKDNQTLVELYLPDSVGTIGSSAMYGASHLRILALPAGLTSIGANAFQNCYELTDVTPFLPNSVTNVGASVFESCTNLSGKICLHGAIRLGANIVATTKVGEVDLDGAPLYSFGAGNYSSVTNFHPLLPPTVGGSCPPSWSGANLGGHQKLCLCSPNFTYLSGDNVRYNTWSDIDMTGSSIAKTGSWCFYGCASLTNVIFSEAFTTFPNVNQAFGGCGALRWVRFRGDPPQALTTNPFGGHAGMCYYFPKWSEAWETYIAEGMKPDGEATVDCKVSEMTSDECKNFLSAHPHEPIPTQRISIGGAGTRAITTTKGFLWWYPKAPPVYKTVALFDLLRYEEQAWVFLPDDEMSPKLFDGTTYTYCKETAHLACRWLVEERGCAEIAVPAAATVARAMRTEGYRVHQMPIGDYANARAPTAWTLYGKPTVDSDWLVLDQVQMTSESEQKWAYFDNPTGYPVTGKTQATPPRAQCSLTYRLPQEKWGRYVAFKFVPTGSYNHDNSVEDATPYGLMELEILGELTTSEPHIGAVSVTRRGWTDMDFAFDLDSIGDRGADGREPQSAVAWVEMATDDTFATIISASAPAAATAGKGIAATVTGLAGRTTYAARVIVSNDLALTAVQTLAGGASTLEAPFELGEVTTSVGENGRLVVTVDVTAVYSAEIGLDLAYRKTMTAEPASLGQKKATAAGAVVFETNVEPGKSSFVDLTVTGDGISQQVTRTPFGFWLADSADAPTRISNSVTRTTFTVTKDTAGLKLSKLVDIGDTATIDLTTLIAAPDGSALAVVSPGTALNSNTDIAELLLPDTVTAIPNDAFKNCSRLNKVRLPATLASIGDSAFSGCAQLAEVENFFPPTCVKLGSSSFYTCAKIPNFTLADGLESIPGNCFYGCSKITDLHIPDSVTNISGGAFAGVSSLTNITPRALPPQIRTSSLSPFHDGNTKCNVPLVLDNPEMKSIPSDGFRYNNFTSIDMLGSSINSIGSLAFYSVPAQWVRFPTNVVTMKDVDTRTFTSTVLREVIFPGEPPVFNMNVFASSYYIIRCSKRNRAWRELLADHEQKGWITRMTTSEMRTFLLRYPNEKFPARYWINLHGLTGKRYLKFFEKPGLCLTIR